MDHRNGESSSSGVLAFTKSRKPRAKKRGVPYALFKAVAKNNNLLLYVFKFLDIVTSFCFGLTCKHLWMAYNTVTVYASWFYCNKGIRPILHLRRPRLWALAGTPWGVIRPERTWLHELLEDWIPAGLVYGGDLFPNKFVTIETYEKAQKERMKPIMEFHEVLREENNHRRYMMSQQPRPRLLQ